MPPPPCPDNVAALLDAALAHHNAGQYAEALAKYTEVRTRWASFRFQ